MPKKSKPVDLILSALIAVMLSVPLTMVASSALGLVVELRPVLILCAAIAALLSLAVSSKGGLAVAIVLGAGGLVALHIGGARPIEDLRALIADFVRLASTGELMLPDHALTIAFLLATVLSAILYWLTRMSGGVYPALTLSVIILLGGWFAERQLNAMYAVPVVAALVAMFARAADDRVAYARVLPIALVVALLAFFVMPQEGIVYPPLQENAEKVRQLFYDYFMFNDPRTAYSLHGDGYLPMADRLGGPAEPHNDPVMLVETPEPLFLRGSIKRTYTGYSWIDNAGNYRYLFGDLTKRSTRDRVFDTGRVQAMSNAGAFKSINAKVTMLGNYTSTLFVPHRIGELTAALDMVAYYNSSGEVFITRGVTQGDGYSLSAEVPVGDTEALGRLVAEGAQRNDEEYRSNYAAYTGLPRAVEDQVFFLTQQVIAGASTPFEKAVRIRDYLYSNYTYSLDVGYPPRDRDFVSYFLLTEQQGYCTYFASAMAVMARMAELPARYVEGYVAIPGTDGSTVVTGQNAHAWVEIYFNGVGWLTFNPTPGMGDMERDEQGQPESGSPPPAGEDPEQQPTEEEPVDPDDGEGEDPVDPQDDPNGDENEPEENQPEDEQPPEDEPEEEQSPEEEPEDTPEDENSETEPPSRSFVWLIVVLILLALAALVFAVLYRVRKTDPKRLSDEYEQPDEQLMVWYRALLMLLEQLGQSPEPNETPDAFAARICALGLAPDSFYQFTLEVSHFSYSGKDGEPAQLDQAEAAYDALRRQLRPLDTVRWMIRRVVYGIGDIHQVP